MSGLPVEGREPWLSAARALIAESGCTIRRYSSGLSGLAWTRDDDWGIRVPRPSSPARFAVFAHEIGHQMLHRHNGSRPRWREEIEAWTYSVDQFERFGLPHRDKAQQLARASIGGAILRGVRGSKDRLQLARDAYEAAARAGLEPDLRSWQMLRAAEMVEEKSA